jgi:RNA polymerase sigma-70 factor, ECF subfamily
MLQCSYQTHEPGCDEKRERSAGYCAPRTRGSVESVLASDYPMYRRLALKRLGDRMQAEDVLHAFCLKALERAPQLRDIRAVHGWLHRLFETALLDHYRMTSRYRARTVPMDDQEGSASALPCEALSVDEEGLVEDTLSRIKPGYAVIIRQVDLSTEEAATVAERLSISPNNLAVRLHRARRAFRTALADNPVSLHA